MVVVELLLVALGVYAGVGVVLAGPLAFIGVNRFDPAARGSGWPFRVLIMPGAVALWPVLLRRWIAGRRSAGSGRAAEEHAHTSGAGVGS